MKQNKKIFSLFVLALLFVVFTKDSLAQSLVGLSAIPPRLELSVAPGKVVTKQIKVRNESNVEKIITTTSRDYIVVDDKGTPVQLEDGATSENRWAASSWIQVSPSKTKIKPGETKSLVVTVIAPIDALPGGHYAMILHTPNNETVLNQTGASVQTNVATLLYITVPGEIKQDALIKDFTAPKFSEYGPVDFKTTVTNFSDIHITPFGNVTVKNWLGGQTAKIDLVDTNIFPYTSRTLTSVLNKKWLFGRYTATFNAGYGTAGQALVASLIFWVIPWKLILLLAVAALLLGVIVYLLKNKPKTPAQVEDQVEELEKELTDLKKKYQDKK